MTVIRRGWNDQEMYGGLNQAGLFIQMGDYWNMLPLLFPAPLVRR